MKQVNSNELYNKIIENLKIEPIIDNNDDLSRKIIKYIEYQVYNKTKLKIMQIIGTISGIAAILLFCLLVSELVFYTDTFLPDKQLVMSVNNEKFAEKEKMWAEMLNNDDIIDKQKFMASYLKDKRKKAMQNEQLFLKMKTLIKMDN